MECIKDFSLSCCHDMLAWPPSPQTQKVLKVAGWATVGCIAAGMVFTGVVLWSTNPTNNENILMTGKILTGVGGVATLRVAAAVWTYFETGEL